MLASWWTTRIVVWEFRSCIRLEIFLGWISWHDIRLEGTLLIFPLAFGRKTAWNPMERRASNGHIVRAGFVRLRVKPFRWGRKHEIYIYWNNNSFPIIKIKINTFLFQTRLISYTKIIHTKNKIHTQKTILKNSSSIVIQLRHVIRIPRI